MMLRNRVQFGAAALAALTARARHNAAAAAAENLSIRTGARRLKNQATTQICRLAQSFYDNRRAVTAIEYALIAGIITVAIVGSLFSTVAPNLNKTFGSIASEL